MAQPLMRVKGRDGVPGILFHLQGRRRPEVIFRGRIPLQSVRSVLLLFKKNAAMWGFGGSFHFPTNTFTIIQDLHKEYYKQGQGQGESCPICPLTKIDEFIGNLLTGQDPLFLLSGSEEPAPLAPVEIRVERGSCLIL